MIYATYCILLIICIVPYCSELDPAEADIAHQQPGPGQGPGDEAPGPQRGSTDHHPATGGAATHAAATEQPAARSWSQGERHRGRGPAQDPGSCCHPSVF